MRSRSRTPRSRPPLRRAAGLAWPLLQATAAATTAWVIARHLIHDHLPFFAPISAVIALNASRGERGLSALRLVLGVFVGILVGEMSVAVLGGGYPALAAATFTALAIARVVARAALVLNQASVAAILTVVSADGQAGPHRLVDALIGTGVALACTQVLFSPEPVGMLRRAQEQALAALAAALDRTARLLDGDGQDVADRFMIEVPGAVVELSQARRTSDRAVRHSALWRRQLPAVEQEQVGASSIDLLAASSLMLCRIAVAAPIPERARLAVPLRRFSHALDELSSALADRAARQRASDEALSALHEFVGVADRTDQSNAAAVTAARLFTVDLLNVLGVNTDEAASAIRSRDHRVDVTAAPSALRLPFARKRTPREMI